MTDTTLPVPLPPQNSAAEIVDVLRALYPELMQLLNGCKLDWETDGSWSTWDQSVVDRTIELGRMLHGR